MQRDEGPRGRADVAAEAREIENRKVSHTQRIADVTPQRTREICAQRHRIGFRHGMTRPAPKHRAGGLVGAEQEQQL